MTALSLFYKTKTRLQLISGISLVHKHWIIYWIIHLVQVLLVYLF